MKWRKYIAGLLAALLAAGMAGCTPGPSSSAEPSGAASAVSEAPAGSAPETGGLTVTHTGGAAFSLDRLMEESTLVARGTVKDADLLVVKQASGAELPVTEYHFAVEEVLRGAAGPSATDDPAPKLSGSDQSAPKESAVVSIRRVGYPAEAASGDECPDEPELEQGKEYLLFLEPQTASNTDEPVYTVLGGKQGVYERTGPLPGRETEGDLYARLSDLEGVAGIRETFRLLADESRREEVRDRADTKTRLESLAKIESSGAELERRLQEWNSTAPADPEQPKKAARNRLKELFENGELTQEEYEKRDAWLDQPDTVVSREPLW